jgi:DNA adenine methylase
MKAFLRWAGSKKQILPTLSRYWNGESTYYEPFAGSCCLFFHLEPRRAVLGDINVELVFTLRGVRNQSKRVIELLSEMHGNRREYNRIRSIDPDSLTIAERAARFIFLNHHSFNGLYRTNTSGQFNVPFGRHKLHRTIDLELLQHASKMLKRASVVQGDFAETISTAKAGDFVYLDPPYFSESKRIFSEYGPKIFGKKDLDRLCICLGRLHKRRVRFAASYWYSNETRSLFARWNTKRIRTRRNIAGFASARRGAYELIACNFDENGDLTA